MKKCISLVLCVVMLFSIFSVCGVASDTADANNMFSIKSSGFKNDKITYTVYLKENVSIWSGVVLRVVYDSNLLEIVSGGPDNNNNPTVPGMYVGGVVDGTDNTYSLGYINADLYNSYETGSSQKAFMKITFKVIGAERPRTSVNFCCVEFDSKDENLDIPKNDNEPEVFYTHVTSTLNQIKMGEACSVEDGMKIEWEATTGATGYRVFKKINGEMTQIGEVPATQTYYIDENVENLGSYTYTVRALDSDGGLDSVSGSNVTSVYIIPHEHSYGEWEIFKKATYTTEGQKVRYCDICQTAEYEFIPKLICSAPKLKSVANTANGVKITWNKVKGAKTYVVLRKTGSGSWKKIAQNIKGTTYTDKTAKSGNVYKYTVRAKSDGGLSKYNTKGISIRYLADPTLKAPASIKSGITLKWSKVTGAQGYIVYRKTGSGSYSKLATVKGVSKVSYTDKKAKKGKKYTYKVKAYYGKTYSAFSNTKTIKDKY